MGICPEPCALHEGVYRAAVPGGICGGETEQPMNGFFGRQGGTLGPGPFAGGMVDWCTPAV